MQGLITKAAMDVNVLETLIGLISYRSPVFVVLVVWGTTKSFMDHLFGNAQMFKQCHRVSIHSDLSSEVIIVKICLVLRTYCPS